ncbi:MAG: type II/IV secretion system protein [Bacteroidetes bacterium]|nr:MAG: type II/IV secretion system protein [Bacteroidota bacterium]
MSSTIDRAPEPRNRIPDSESNGKPKSAASSADNVAVPFETAIVRDRVIARLKKNDVVTDSQLEKAWTEWSRLRMQNIRVPLWRLLTMDQSLDSDDIFVEAASVYAFKEVEIEEKEALAFIEACKEDFDDSTWDNMVELFVLPVSREPGKNTPDSKWTFATHDPTRPEVHQLIQSLNLRRFEIMYLPQSMVGILISESFANVNQYLEKLEDAPAVFDMGMEFTSDDELVDGEALDAEINRSRLINLFEAALVEAVTRGASDLHIYPNADGHVEIHMRIDGDLEQWHLEDNIRPEAFLSVVKDNSTNVDRFDRDSAQDGFIQRWVDGTLIRFRVSILPIASAKQEIHAESIVIRILDDRKVLTDLSKIGLNDVAMARFDMAIRQPNGMVILTGPTGSGKSTTLVAALYQVVTPKVNVLTVEDPVEYLMRGIRQIKLSHKLDLEGALRAILRHDPDIVMVGEMRDQQTAELAIKLANTGHLTFTTLHTNDAPSAVSRLFKMGVEPFLIAYAINLVVAQRLIRKLCDECKEPENAPDEDTLRHLGFTEEELSQGQLYKAGDDAACPVCKGAGFKGRRALAETLLFTARIRNIIMESNDSVDEDGLRAAAVEDGMMTLTECGRSVAMEGETTIEEVLRVTGSTL